MVTAVELEKIFGKITTGVQFKDGIEATNFQLDTKLLLGQLQSMHHSWKNPLAEFLALKYKVRRIVSLKRYVECPVEYHALDISTRVEPRIRNCETTSNSIMFSPHDIRIVCCFKHYRIQGFTISIPQSTKSLLFLVAISAR